MCGKFTLTAEPRHIEKRFGAKFITTDWHPTYNAAPSQLLPVILGGNLRQTFPFSSDDD